MKLSSIPRESVAFAIAGAAIILRMVSDYLFASGGPLPYQLLQGCLLFLALTLIWPHLETVFLRGGQTRLAIKIGLLGVPLGLLFGLGDAWLDYGQPLWPSPVQIVVPVANNIFFSAVEELEFRGFVLSQLLRRKLSPLTLILLVTVLSSLAHAHRFWQGDIRSIVVTIAVNAWWTWLTYHTRSLWGAWVAHTSWNIFVILPELGLASTIR